MENIARDSGPRAFAIAALAAASLLCLAAADTAGSYEIRYENHRFAPSTLSVPAGRRLVIEVVNASRETIEFESFKLNREKVVGPGEKITVRLPELKPGSYDFFDDFDQGVPEGAIVAK